jgi:hypothetical protein
MLIDHHMKRRFSTYLAELRAFATQPILDLSASLLIAKLRGERDPWIDLGETITQIVDNEARQDQEGIDGHGRAATLVKR